MASARRQRIVTVVMGPTLPAPKPDASADHAEAHPSIRHGECIFEGAVPEIRYDANVACDNVVYPVRDRDGGAEQKQRAQDSVGAFHSSKYLAFNGSQR